MKAARASICRMIRDGLGIDDIRVETGLSYVQIWGCLKRSAVLSRRLLPYERIAMSRAIAEADAKRGAA